MQITPGVSVFTSDDKEAGRVERVVIDPRTREVTHLVVGSSLLFNDSRIIPIPMITSADEDRIVLLEDQTSLENLPYFEQTHFIPPSEAGDTNKTPEAYPPPLYWYPPAGMSSMGFPGFWTYPTRTEQNLPEDLVALRDGAKVTDIAEEDIGEIERMIMEKESGKVTHLVVGWGLIQRSHKLVPAHWVEGVEEDQVRLAVHKREIESLPEYND
jgi:uncharacterized protein YrrD